MPAPLIKATDKAIHQYQLTLREFRDASIDYESATRHAFQTLLTDTARRRHWQLVPELPIKLSSGRTIEPDGTIRDEFTIHRGYWEAKDTRDDLEIEIKKKIANGYPESNILFEDTRRAILIQNNVRAFGLPI